MNTNCMAGLRCPECGGDDSLLVQALLWVELTDDGTDPFADSTRGRGEVAFDGNNYAACPACGFEAKLRRFHIKRKTTKG